MDAEKISCSQPYPPTPELIHFIPYPTEVGDDGIHLMGVWISQSPRFHNTGEVYQRCLLVSVALNFTRHTGGRTALCQVISTQINMPSLLGHLFLWKRSSVSSRMELPACPIKTNHIRVGCRGLDRSQVCWERHAGLSNKPPVDMVWIGMLQCTVTIHA